MWHSEGTWRSIKGARTPVTRIPEQENATGNFISIYNATLPGVGNQTMIIRCIGSNDNCTFSGTGPYFGGGLHANSTS